MLIFSMTKYLGCTLFIFQTVKALNYLKEHLKIIHRGK
jgi:hypothetical protein